MKTCTRCKIEKPFEAFRKFKRAKDGHTPECKECNKERCRELKKNPLMQLEKQIRSSIILENKLLAREGKKLCCKCKDIFLIDDLLSTGRCKNCNIEHSKKYYIKNKDKLKEYQKEYNKEYYKKYGKLKEYQKEYNKEYQQKNKDKINEYNRQYRLKKKLEKENKTDVTS